MHDLDALTGEHLIGLRSCDGFHDPVDRRDGFGEAHPMAGRLDQGLGRHAPGERALPPERPLLDEQRAASTPSHGSGRRETTGTTAETIMS